jgi:hypothetical protein
MDVLGRDSVLVLYSLLHNDKVYFIRFNPNRLLLTTEITRSLRLGIFHSVHIELVAILHSLAIVRKDLVSDRYLELLEEKML